MLGKFVWNVFLAMLLALPTQRALLNVSKAKGTQVLGKTLGKTKKRENDPNLS